MVAGVNYIFDIVLGPSWNSTGGCDREMQPEKCHVEVVEGLQQQREINLNKTSCDQIPGQPVEWEDRKNFQRGIFKKRNLQK